MYYLQIGVLRHPQQRDCDNPSIGFFEVDLEVVRTPPPFFLVELQNSLHGDFAKIATHVLRLSKQSLRKHLFIAF